MNDPPHPLALLIHLQQRLCRAASLEEIRYILVNETHPLLPCRQAILWDHAGQVAAISGVVEPEQHAPFVQWLRKIHPELAKGVDPAGERWDASRLPVALREQWAEWLPPEGWVLPLRHGADRGVAGVWLMTRAAGGEWTEMERSMAIHLAETAAMALANHRASPPWRSGPAGARIGIRLLKALALAGLLLLPVQLSVLAPAEVVAVDPAVIRAPMDGVVDEFLVRPNQEVEAGQPLFRLDATTLDGKLEVAVKTLETVETEYRQTLQQAIQDPASKTRMAILAGRIEEQRLEVGNLRDLLERIRVKSPRAGVAIFNDPYDWIGRPVVTGERVLNVATPDDTEVEAWLAAGDLIRLAPGAPVTMFVNIDPLHPLHAKLRYLAYEADKRPDGAYAYRLRATLAPGEERPSVGWKGSARIDGERVTLAYWLLRRPLAMMRQWLGR
ncbi:MAG: HlyD family efflux transporter periplasmic adaptor subunit [Magnetococcales bacterium]|nr:HlyD family efflux transporter periplasmic adaptor subunit [Magnetococcales bacterium]